MAQISTSEIDKAFAAVDAQPPQEPGKLATLVEQPRQLAKTPIRIEAGKLVPANFEEVGRIATMMVRGNTIPPSYWGSNSKPRNYDECLAAVTMAIFKGMRQNMDPFEAVQNQYVVNNVPRFWGKAVPGIVKGKLYQRGERAIETLTYKGEGEARVCTMKVVHETADGRKLGEIERSFSMANAKAQGLLGKDTWKHSADRMLMHRARTYCYDDLFPDLMMGIEVAEVADDIVTIEQQAERKSLDQRLAETKHTAETPQT